MSISFILMKPSSEVVTNFSAPPCVSSMKITCVISSFETNSKKAELLLIPLREFKVFSKCSESLFELCTISLTGEAYVFSSSTFDVFSFANCTADLCPFLGCNFVNN